MPASSTPPEHPFAQYVRTLGKGKSGTRSLSLAESRQAFGMILRGEVEPVQLGAFLMLLRVKEESPDELAGFVQACRSHMQTAPKGLSADLDWSCYAGKKHQHPWFILSMLLLTNAGYRVFVHGCDGHTAGRLYTEQALLQLDLPVAQNWAEVDDQLDLCGLSYLPLRHFCEPLHDIMQLKPILGLRSPVNTLARLLNPVAAACSIQSVFHPAYAGLHQQADTILGQPRALVFKGDSGEIEIKPQADTRILYLDHNRSREEVLARSMSQRITSVGRPAVEPVRMLWSGEAEDPYGRNATLATTAVALRLLDNTMSDRDSSALAETLWRDRDKTRLR